MRKSLIFVPAALLLLIISACATNKYYREFVFGSVQNNVCKTLDEKVVLYAIFVDSKHTGPWSDYDISSTRDSICKAISWIEEKAKSDSVDLDISLEIHQGTNGKFPIKQDLKRKTLSSTFYEQPMENAQRDIYKWADRIASVAGKSLPKENSKSIGMKNTLRDRERLIARLRDIHKTDNIAIMYFVNNYYKDELSVALNTNSDKNVEFAVVSFKNPSVIAHEFLHLFGAEDMYVTSFDKKKKDKNIRMKFNKMFPNEIMTNSSRNLDSLVISDFTKYLIGWDKELAPQYQKEYMRKGWKAAAY